MINLNILLEEIFTSADHATMTHIDNDHCHLAMLAPRPIKQAKSSPAPAPAELPPQPSPWRKRGRVVRASDLKSVGPRFKSRSDR